mmetsp:Transcript_1704/g.5789  ORF Transcript_1704/g.5789 Transcript_1704/m.5789 type:complete len:259 (-) Transcript_1704:1329-2105(-)
MKIVLEGIRGSGKTSLRRRLRGSAFRNAYKATTDVEMTSFEWSPPEHYEPEDVEIWEVADLGTDTRSSKKGLDEVLTSATATQSGGHSSGTGRLPDDPPREASAWATRYQGAHGVVFMVDPSRLSSLKYVLDRCAAVPSNLPVAVLTNFFDRRALSSSGLEEEPCDDHRLHPLLLTGDDIRRSVMVALRHQTQRTYLRCLECSMANCFGLTAFHEYLAVPFLHMRLETQVTQAQQTQAHLAANMNKSSLSQEDSLHRT